MLTRTEIACHPRLMSSLKVQAQALLAVEKTEPRAAAVFGTQQRFLLAQLGISMVFSNGGDGILLSRFLEAAVGHNICSRNTAHSFVQEMIRYGFARQNSEAKDRRTRPIHITALTQQMAAIWVGIHLATLDTLAGGGHVATFMSRPDLLPAMQPILARALLASPDKRDDDGTFSLFTWMNDGGLVMDKMIASIASHDPTAERIVTGLSSFDALSEPLRITRAHLSRKMAAAEEIGEVGWEGKRGASPLWISRSFLKDYEDYQAEKLAHIAAAFHAVAR